MAGPVRERAAMIAGMRPEAMPGEWVFCTVDEAQAVRLAPRALGSFREAEGLSLILPREDAAARGIGGAAMRQITLQVHSALDGVGLTAAVAETLAGAGIPCNVVAAHHHDHVFVPAERAEEALALLRARAARAP